MRILNIIIAEDIRRELGNKLSLMGILGGRINLPESYKDANLHLPIAGLVSVETGHPENDHEDFNASIFVRLGDEKIGEINAKIESAGVGGVVHLPVRRFQIPAVENTDLVICVKITKSNEIIDTMERSLDIVFTRPPS